jgi:hypothetical protein
MGPPVFSSDYSASGEHTLIAGWGLVLRAANNVRRLPEKAAAQRAFSRATMGMPMILRRGMDEGKPLKSLDR